MIETTLFDWLIHIPEYIAAFGSWLVKPIGYGIEWSPLAILGTSAGVAVGALLIFHVVHLVNPVG